MHKSSNETIILRYLKKLGFSSEEATLYLTLAEKGPLSLLDASRASGIERTKLYRMIDSLTARKLLEGIPQHKRKLIKAVDVGTIQLLVKEKELEQQDLENSLTTFTKALNTIKNSTSGNNVVYYQGIPGIKQMVWNMLRCEGLFRTYSYRFWDDLLGSQFSIEINKELLARNFIVHDLYSDQYVTYKNQWMKEKKFKPKGDWHFWESRYISEKIVTINQNIDIYNDVVSYYHWQGNETFGVEIYNQRVADLQKQMHDVLWKMAKRNPALDWKIPWK